MELFLTLILAATAAPAPAPVVVTSSGVELSVVLETGTTFGDELLRSVDNLDVNEVGIVGVASFLFPTILESGLVVQRFGAEPFLIADETTVLPGQAEPPIGYAKPTAIGHNVFFQASTYPVVGIYRWNESEGLSLVVDDANPVPELGGARFFIFDDITKLDDGLVFGAGYTGGFGIFLWRNGQVEHLVAPGDVTEEGETLLGASFPRGEGTLLAFVGGTTESGGGAFVRKHDGSLKRIVAVGEEIAGASVRRLLVDADRESVALRLDHPDANEVTVFRARFPEPAPATTEIPTLSEIGFVLLTLTLALAGLKLLRRSA